MYKKKMLNINQVLFVYCKVYTHARALVWSVQNVAEWTKTPITDIFLRLYNDNNNNNNITYAPRALIWMAVSNKTIFYCPPLRSMDKNVHCVRARPGLHGTKDTARPGLPHVCVHMEICTRIGHRTNRAAVLIYRKQFSGEYHYYRYCRYHYYYYYCYYLESASDSVPWNIACMLSADLLSLEMAAATDGIWRDCRLTPSVGYRERGIRAYTAVGRQRVWPELPG